ncbi:MAG: hypothetical protein HY821_19535 [Acidobacteria bacterium]|nr:hypothetical protein [Acidobacteriota bacterium]
MTHPVQLPDQPISVPRRAMDFEDYVDIVRRHRSWILGPAFAGLVIGVVTAYLWPDSYLATGLIRVVPPQVPTRLVQTNVSEEMTSRINTVYQNIISRASLLDLIQTNKLYTDELKRLPTDDVVEQMRRDIGLGNMQYMSRGAGIQQTVNAFSVSFSYSDRRLAQKVCLALITRFTEESIRSRASMSENTTSFLKDQYELAKRDLDEIDSRIAAFRTRNVGELPEQEQMMFSRITAMEAQVQAANGQISRAQQDKLQLEAQLRDLREQAQMLSQPVPESVAVPTMRNDRLIEAERDIERAEAALTTMRESYKDSHPDVQKLLGYIETKRKLRDQIVRDSEANKADASGKPRMVISAANQTRVKELSSAITRIQSTLQARDMEIEELSRQIKDSAAKLRAAQARLESSPGANQEYVQLMRDRSLIASRFEELGRKMQDSSMATELVNRGQGEMLEMLEAPVIPEAPYAPKRPLIIGVGIVLGFGLGIALAAGREIKDTSLKNLKDVRAYTKLTVLGSVPLLENDFVLRRRRRFGWLMWAAALVLGALLIAGAIAYYYMSRA